MNIKSGSIAFVLILCLFGCKESEKYSEVRKTLEKVLEDDQKFRQPTYDYINQNPLDRKNLQIVTKIIDSLGWLGKDQIGKDANTALFVTIQHASQLSVMEKYLPVIQEAVKKGNAEKKQLAYLVDRVELLNNREQVYGTQYSVKDDGKVFIRNLKDSSHVNLRRKSMDLEPLEDYLKMIDSLNQ